MVSDDDTRTYANDSATSSQINTQLAQPWSPSVHCFEGIDIIGVDIIDVPAGRRVPDAESVAMLGVVDKEHRPADADRRQVKRHWHG